ncbi:hypothetical protein [Pseudomonas antarctica]|uniref:hypothetical protein n=1 Tax=Pseudomonas antarctica TaxID=219572 RepID=UPI00345D975E
MPPIILLGSVDEATSALERARRLIAEAPDPEALAYLTSEVQHLDRLIADWKAYSENPVGGFPEWCAKLGRDYTYSAKVYYERRGGDRSSAHQVSSRASRFS